MGSVSDLRRRYDAQRLWRGLNALPRFHGSGLALGRGTVLAHVGTGPGAAGLDGDRLAALLLVAHGHAMPLTVVKHAPRAAAYWRRGEGVLAHIELAFACLPRLAAEDDAFRLFLAEVLLDDGLLPGHLARALGVALVKYDPDQPRVPAGNGRDSGRWGPGSEADGAGALGTTRVAEMAPVVARSFLTDANPSIVRALAAFAARFAVPTAVLGALFIPTPNTGGVTEGTLPGIPDVRFRLDGPAGLLRLARTLPDGSEAVAVAQSRLGIYYSGDTALGRALGMQLYLDLATVAAVLAPHERDKPHATADEPQLCPAPTPDTGHGASDRAKDYEDDVHARANPIAPIPRGFAVRIIDPETGRAQYPDDCLRYVGDLIEGDMRAGDFADAKGEEYARLVTLPFAGRVINKLVETTEKHLRAAEARGAGLKVYFAEKDAADYFQKMFKADDRLRNVAVGFLPPSKPKQGRRR